MSTSSPNATSDYIEQKGARLDEHSMHESLLLLVERDEKGNSVMSTNGTYGELHGVAVQLAAFLADFAEIPYNQLLDELKEKEMKLIKEEI